MAVGNNSVKTVAHWLMFLALVTFYIGAYAPFGLENNDGGFMLGLSFQVFKGSHLYSDVLYVRPPLSPLLHEFVFFWPFSGAPVLADRVFFYAQIATSSLFSSLVVRRLLGWGLPQVVAVAAMGFMLSAHAFPAMGWHTVDGIFFFTLSLYALLVGLNRRYGVLILSAGFAIGAAACKQPFYIVPPLILVLAVILRGGSVVFSVLLASMAVMLGLMWAWLHIGGVTHIFWESITSQTSLQDLLQAGVLDYLHDMSGPRISFVVLPLSIGLVVSALDLGSRRFQAGALLFAGWLILLMVGRHYWRADSWSQPFPVFDSVFVVTLVCSLLMAWTRRDAGWGVIVGMHSVAWAASISWGNQTSALYAVPSAIVVGHFLGGAARDMCQVRWMGLAMLPLGLAVFFVGNQYAYSLEGAVRRSSNVEDMGSLSPSLHYIRATTHQRALYSDFLDLRGRFSGAPFVVMPNMPLAHMLVNEVNPIGVDWVLNVEIGKRANDVLDRLRNRVGYAFVRKHAIPAPQAAGKFGSDVSIFVMRHWMLINETPEFLVYKNPHFTAGKELLLQTEP